MREPSFNETLQIGIVVHDLETAMRRYVDDYGIGPWDIHEFNAGNAEDLHEHGRPVERSWRLATTMVGRVQWELIEPLDDESIYARFLAEKGEGVHHIGYGVTDISAALEAVGATGVRLVDARPRHGSMGASIAFLHPADLGGVLTELVQPLIGP